MTSPESQTALRALLRDKVHVQRGIVARLPSAQAERLRSPLDLSRLLLHPLNASPAALLSFWAYHPRGHAVINLERAGYQPGLHPVGRYTMDCVAWVTVRRLLDEPQLAPPIAHLLDHLLGSDGDPDGPWLSDGAGRSPIWAEVAARLVREFKLGYAPGEAATNPHMYFAWGLRTYLSDRPSLNVADPGLERLLRTTLLDPGFWRRPDA